MSKITYLCEDIACQKCAATIVNALSGEFDDISVQIEQKEVTVSLQNKELEKKFIAEMDNIGFPVTKELGRE